jgi:hypothetical protein
VLVAVVPEEVYTIGVLAEFGSVFVPKLDGFLPGLPLAV